MKFKLKNNLIYHCNFILILILIPIKMIDFIMSLEYIGTNNIVEVNPLGYFFLANPILTLVIFTGLILFYILYNIIFKELVWILFIILIIFNLTGICVLFNNFQILFEVLN